MSCKTCQNSFEERVFLRDENCFYNKRRCVKKDVYVEDEHSNCEIYDPRELKACFITALAPYVLIYKTKNEKLATEFLETKGEIVQAAKELKAIGCQIINALEFSTGRKIRC